ncbi:cytochrome c-type biogenesis protein [Polymorphum gilvum]|uniref:Cytochrome c-type biogenesis protein n=1 Tax=Polymorphum gilvum (strain LMG 25793 / CGMCC 1.9160 / SL003B-26A1) TaxID=991905 RepID=F2J6F5_POLGS|nr:cytochrome c-type biogenesis protein [Polymorphum gilvum]ADZ71329.1 Cytochrome C biogenesis protein [Polymorphum gilvum SL003B-26A1]
MTRVASLLIALLVAGLVAAGSALAVAPDEVLDDPALEARARALSAELRCMVCQNQSIDDSDAPLAKDLRVLVRERLVAGDSDAQVLDYLVSRYGEFVLLKPRIAPHTYVLWAAAPLALLAGFVGIVVALRRQRGQRAVSATVPLSAEEQAELDRILGKAPAGSTRES